MKIKKKGNEEFKENFEIVHQLFDISQTLKIYVIVDHYSDYLEMTGNKDPVLKSFMRYVVIIEAHDVSRNFGFCKMCRIY